MIDWFKRRRASRGTLPADKRAELEREGIELLEERIRGRVTYRGYEMGGQRPATGDAPTVAALAITPTRLAIHGTNNLHVDAGHGIVRSEAPEPEKLVLRYEASDLYPMRAGSVEIELWTPRAADIHARLQAWIERSAT
ncbi:MAG TPA: hypothetical protein VFM58_06360 [Solirubrobacteraceae bacterium]|nr:hypothetical protein [Solirubrobacteraceae bacterium]